jgi:uncharacterized protein
MNIEIIGCESLGVRGMCCFVETKSRKILIDPGIALGYSRYGLLPHPCQVAEDEAVQKKIIEKWSEASDVVISHFHGDHVPLLDANPYQLDLKKMTGLNHGIRVWVKNFIHLPPTEKKRAESLSTFLNKELIEAEGKEEQDIVFSGQVPHGEAENNTVTVMMTKIRDGNIFVHASDIQLFDTETVLKIIKWKPDIVFAGGPPIYLSDRIPEELIKKAWDNAIRLSRRVKILIIDHHLMRSREGEIWLDKLNSITKNKIICGADFMRRPRKLLEADRRQLYKDIPVDSNWHKMYSEGKVSAGQYIIPE